MADKHAFTSPTKRRVGRPQKSESAKKRRKRATDAKSHRSRINIGAEIDRWNAFKEQLWLKSNAETAKLFLDRFEFELEDKAVLPKSKSLKTSTPACKDMLHNVPDVSEISSDSDVRVSGLSGIEVLTDSEIGKQETYACSSKPEISSSFINPFDLTMEVTEDDMNVEQVDSDEDYEPPHYKESNNIVFHRPSNSAALEDVAFAEVEFGDHRDDIEEEEEIIPEVDIAGPRIKRVLSFLDHSVVTEDETYLCFLGQIINLAHAKIPESCTIPSCGQPVKIVHESVGSALYLKWNCSNGHLVHSWCSQPILNRRLHSGDLLISAALLLSGNNYSKIALMARYLRMHFVSVAVFHRIQRTYLVPAIDQYWEKTQAAVISGLNSQKLVLLGDGRMDSPGHCAQYCSYTMMENSTKEIVSLVTLDKSHTAGKSSNLEKACFTKSLTSLTQKRVEISEVVTDSHMQITSLMKRSHPDIRHSFDIWHSAKNLNKMIVKAGQEKGCKDLLQWSKHVTNHFYHAAQKANSYQEFMAIWTGVLHHVVNEHQWLFDYGSGSNSCSHGLLTEERNVKWLEAGSKAHQALVKIVLDRRLQNNVPYYLNFRSTAELESFQNLILMYAAKRFSYSPPVYRARNLLAALDHNAHVHRGAKLNKDGSIPEIVQQKSGRWTVTEVKEEKTYPHIPEVIKTVFRIRLQDGSGMQGKMILEDDDPRHISRTLSFNPPPATNELVEQKKSRLK